MTAITAAAAGRSPGAGSLAAGCPNPMAVGGESGPGGLKRRFHDKDVIGVEGRDREDADTGVREGLGDRQQDAIQSEVERTGHGKSSPAGSRVDPGRNASSRANDGGLVAGPGYREEGAVDGPGRERGTGGQAADRQLVGDERQVEGYPWFKIIRHCFPNVGRGPPEREPCGSVVRAAAGCLVRSGRTR